MAIHTRGVDVSSHQPPHLVPWPELVAAGVGFMYARAGFGLGPDTSFPEHVKRSRAGGVDLHGGYWAFRPARPVLAQVDLLCAALDRAGGEVFPVLDLEIMDGMRPREVAEGAFEFVERLECRRGVRCVVYSYPFFLKALPLAPALASRPLAIAQYQASRPIVPAPWSSYLWWQNDGDGGERAPGGLDLDFNICQLTVEQLRAELFRPLTPA